MNIDIRDLNTDDTISSVREQIANKAYRACVITFGCQQNEADSEKIRAMCIDMGYSLTDEPAHAELIILNTCAIRELAEMKVFSMLGRFKAHKAERDNVIIGVCGCMAAEESAVKRLKGSFKYVDFTLEPSKLFMLPSLVLASITEGERRFVYGQDSGDIVEGMAAHRASDYRAWVSVMYGCNNFCSYCIVPYVRGRERSRASSDVLKECRELVERGYKEITLLGQNVNSYKSDMTFAQLLEEVARIEGDFIIRFMTSHPKDVSDELISVMGRYQGKVAPYFHLPLQSGSNRILKLMNRTYDREKYLKTVDKLRSAVKDIVITSDIIVGFPSESDEDFEDTLDMLRRVEFDMLYSFIYSVRRGTRAEKMEGHLPKQIKSERLKRLHEVQNEISARKNLPYLNTVQRVLVDSVTHRADGDVYAGRTLGNKLVHFKSDKDLIGQFQNVKIVRTADFDLYAELI